MAFIAVNSGTNRTEAAKYAAQKQIAWPIVVDADRAFERAHGVQQISLNNIYQMRVIEADGSVSATSPTQLAQAVDRSLQTAKWNVDPAQVPAVLKPAWTAVEFGNFAAAVPLLKGHLKSIKPDVKAAAEQLQSHALAKLEARLAPARAALAGDGKWEAYKIFAAAAVEFKGSEPTGEAEKGTKELANDAAVKTELAALKRLESARKLAASPASQKRGLKLLEALAADSPETEAGQQAKQLLAGGQN